MSEKFQIDCLEDTFEDLPEVFPSDVFQCDPILVPIFTYEQALFVGRENLQHLKEKWEEILSKAKPTLERQEELMELLDGKTVEDLREVAAQYDNPQYISQWKGSEEKREPCNAEAFHRSAGSTTLNICGWCRYAIPQPASDAAQSLIGERVYRPNCGALNDTWRVHRECEGFDMPCLLTLPRTDTSSVSEIYAGICERHAQYVRYCRMVQKRMKYLDEMITKAESKPLFPCYRKYNHYAVGTLVYELGDEAYECLPYPFTGKLQRLKLKIMRGTVIKNDDSSDWGLYLAVDSAVYGREIWRGCTYNSVRLVSFEELTYLLGNPDFAQLWAVVCGKAGETLVGASNFYHCYRYLTM